jgi:hypothetical protein
MALPAEPPAHDAKATIIALPEDGADQALGTAWRRGLAACNPEDDDRIGLLYRARADIHVKNREGRPFLSAKTLIGHGPDRVFVDLAKPPVGDLGNGLPGLYRCDLGRAAGDHSQDHPNENHQDACS